MKPGLRNSIKDAATRAQTTGTAPRWFNEEQWNSIIKRDAEARELRKVLRGIEKAIARPAGQVDLPSIRLWVAIGLKRKRR